MPDPGGHYRHPPGAEFNPQFTDLVRLNFSQDRKAAVERRYRMAQRYQA